MAVLIIHQPQFLIKWQTYSTCSRYSFGQFFENRRFLSPVKDPRRIMWYFAPFWRTDFAYPQISRPTPTMLTTRYIQRPPAAPLVPWITRSHSLAVTALGHVHIWRFTGWTMGISGAPTIKALSRRWNNSNSRLEGPLSSIHASFSWDANSSRKSSAPSGRPWRDHGCQTEHEAVWTNEGDLFAYLSLSMTSTCSRMDSAFLSMFSASRRHDRQRRLLRPAYMPVRAII